MASDCHLPLSFKRLQALARERRQGNTQSVFHDCDLKSSGNSTASPGNGLMCSLSIFMRAAGIVHFR